MSSEINPTNNEVVETHDYHKAQDISPISEQNADNENEIVNSGYIANSSRIDKQKQLRPDQVWKHFESHKGEGGTEWAICRYCKKKLVGLINTGSKHLENHLERCRKKINIGDRGGDHKAADQAGNWLTNPIPVIEQPLKEYEIRMIIKDDPTASRLHSIPADQIIQVYKKEKERFRTYLEDLSCRYCLKFDIDGNYFSCAVQFINENWEMREKIIRLTKMEEDGNILRCLKAVLLEWGIDKNISSISDCRRLLEKDRVKYVMHFNEIESWFSNRGALPFAGKLSYFYSFHYLAFDFYELAHSNVFDKITAIFNYVKKTSSAEQKFQIAIETAKSLGKEVTAEVIPEMVDGDWRDKKFLEVATGYKEAFFELEKIDTEFESINFTKEQWHLIAPSFYDYFAEFDFIVDRGFHDLLSYYTANMAFVLLCELYTISLPLEKFHLLFDDDESFYWFRDFMEDYWSKNNMLLAAAAVLDPRFKLEIVEHWYKKIYGSEYEKQLTLFKDYFTDVYNEYARPDSSGKSPSDSSISYRMLDLSGKPCKSSNDLEDVPLQKSELDLYLKEFKFPSIEEFDILNWWRVNNQYFPTLAKMARDFFSIEIFAAGALYTFDLEDILYNLRSNGFDVDIVGEALICTNSLLKSP